MTVVFVVDSSRPFCQNWVTGASCPARRRRFETENSAPRRLGGRPGSGGRRSEMRKCGRTGVEAIRTEEGRFGIQGYGMQAIRAPSKISGGMSSVFAEKKA
ncbi:hypothetical protein GWI33_020477 [Rhynchophorus ferrugineus]|uniref:Uncharacterized protein n=1 Tax=Rhynchophorus ferrugineus TaxID=354439 RepID=A0A834HSE0_RHYFE|nr:hypothetical protein GWI33_020477 [Rhynchophorus ferrugineus]